MRNQNLDIPAHLRLKCEGILEEVRKASEELQRAQANYQKAILARIAMIDEINASFAENPQVETHRLPADTEPAA